MGHKGGEQPFAASLTNDREAHFATFAVSNFGNDQVGSCRKAVCRRCSSPRLHHSNQANRPRCGTSNHAAALATVAASATCGRDDMKR